MPISSALALKGYVPGGSFGSPGAAAGELQAPEGLAVNAATGNLYVADTGNARIDEFDTSGTFVRAWGWGVADGLPQAETCTISCQKGIAGSGAGQFSTSAFVTVDNSTELTDPSKGDVYVADSTNNTVQRFSENGTVEAEFKGTCETPGEPQPCSGSKLIPFGELEGVGVDGAGNLWVYDSNSNLDEFSSTGEFLKTFVSEHGAHPGALTFDSLGDLYVIGGEEVRVLKFDSATGTELENTEPNSTYSNGVTAIAVVPSTERLLVNDGEPQPERGPPRIDLYGPFGEPSNKPEQTFASEGFTESHGLAVDAQETAFASMRSAGRVQVFDYVPLRPAIEHVQVSNVGETEAVVSAHVNAFEEPTTYFVEYGPTQAYESSTPETSIGAPAESVPVQAGLTGLEAGTEYHFRVVAESQAGTAFGADEKFSTAAKSPGAPGLLPDNRVMELVSSPTENQTVNSLAGANAGLPTVAEDQTGLQPVRAAAGGDAVAYSGNPSSEGGSGTFGDGQANEWVATRSQTGWTPRDVTPPGSDSTAEYAYFSGDLSVGLLLAGNGTAVPASPASPPSCEKNVFSLNADGSKHALVAQPDASGSCGEPVELDSSVDGSHLLFADHAALTAGAAEGKPRTDPSTIDARLNLYDSVAGHLYQVNILPDGHPEPAPVAWFGSPRAGEEGSAGLTNVVSKDGSRIFWTSSEPPLVVPGEPVGNYEPKALYVRLNDTAPQSPIGTSGECTVPGDACTVQLDVGEAGCVAEGKCESGGGMFWTASGDASKVFFTDCKRLTSDSTAVPGGCVRERGTTARGYSSHGEDLYEYDLTTGQLTDLTVDHNAGDAHRADVAGVIGAGEDGSYVYFVASGVLTEAANPLGKKAVAGEANLYLRHGDVTTFIADGSGGSGESLYLPHANVSLSPGNRTAEVTPDGNAVVFQGEGGVQVYDAVRGRLLCASCNPAAPTAPASGLLPVSGGGGRLMKAYSPRWISDDGSRVFFDTVQALVPQDTNGRIDVYEWERNGAGSCAPVVPALPEPGCVYLLSGGQSPDNSYFADADANGNNVFITSRGHLAPPARNENVAMYDARVAGGFPEVSTACTGTGCQGVPPAPPAFATPSSVTFTGVGNFGTPQIAKPKTAAKVRAERRAKALKACRKVRSKRKRTACERRAKRQYGAVKPKRPRNSRRAGR